MINKIMIMIFVLLTWVYATGNLPGTLLAEEGLSSNLNKKYPVLTQQTARICEYFWNSLRKFGIHIPLSHRERCKILESIKKIKKLIELFDDGKKEKSNAFQNYV